MLQMWRFPYHITLHFSFPSSALTWQMKWLQEPSPLSIWSTAKQDSVAGAHKIKPAESSSESHCEPSAWLTSPRPDPRWLTAPASLASTSLHWPSLCFSQTELNWAHQADSSVPAAPSVQAPPHTSSFKLSSWHRISHEAFPDLYSPRQLITFYPELPWHLGHFCIVIVRLHSHFSHWMTCSLGENTMFYSIFNAGLTLSAQLLIWTLSLPHADVYLIPHGTWCLVFSEV